MAPAAAEASFLMLRDPLSDRNVKKYKIYDLRRAGISGAAFVFQC